jgi:transaldolase
MDLWRPRIEQLIRERATATEEQIAWRIVDEISIKGATLLHPIFDKHRGRNGRLSVQTDPRFYRDADAIVRQGEWFNGLAPNIIVKIPVTSAGVAAIEEATYRGISINATVCFTLPQCVAVAEAVERGLRRREAEGLDIAAMGPVCTIMEGRLDDWLKVVADREQLAIDRGALEWAGVAVFKKTYQLFRQRGYRIRLLAAAFRNTMHWSELIGGDVVISPPHQWQVKFNASEIAVVPRITQPVEPAILAQLMKFDDFRSAYNEDGLSVAAFDSYPPTRRTLRQFVAACHDLDAQIREIMIPNPDGK